MTTQQSPARTGTDQKTLRAAMVGLRHGHVGRLDPARPSQGYIHSLKNIPGVELVAYVEDADPKLLEFARTFDPAASVYQGVDELIARETFDFAVVVLPANEVPEVGIKLARAGKHIFMEKQFARTAAELEPLVRAVERAGVVCQAGYPWRYHPAMRELRRLIGEGIFGKPLSIEGQLVTGQVKPGLRDPSSFLYTRANEGGGIMHMLGGHYLELMRALMGCEVVSVQAMTGRPVGHIEEPLEDVAIAILEYENGALGSLHAGYLQPVSGIPYDARLTYRGLTGFAVWPEIAAAELTVLSTAPAWIGSLQRTFRYSFEAAPGYGGQTWYQSWLTEFVESVRERRQPEVSAEVGLRILKVVDAVYESARTGRRVSISYGA